ncbi:MAG: glycosyltransferase family 9 protein [Betaproteobacteria bacterium]
MNAVPAIGRDQAVAARRVLAINVTRIGDTLLATPALRAIAAFFPNARITCLGYPMRVAVIEHLPYIDKVGAITKRSARWRGWGDVLRGAEYDWAFVWGEDEALVRYALRKARHVVAARQRDDVLNAKLFAAVDLPNRSHVHAVAWTLALPQAVGIPAQGYRLDCVVTADEARIADARLARAGNRHSGNGPLIGMQVASFATKSYRDWPIAQFTDLAKRVLAQWPDAQFVLYGSAEEEARIAMLVAQLSGHATSYAGLPLRETAAVMSRNDLYIGVDTGPTHMFSALQKPMVVLYHPALPSARFRPLQHAALYAIDHPRAGQDADEAIPIGEIGVDTVFAEVLDALAGKPSTRPGMPAAGLEA